MTKRTLNLSARTELEDAYQRFTERWNFHINLMLRPACVSTRRDTFTKQIRQLFTDTEKHYFGYKTLKYRRLAELRIWRFVWVEREETDIHAHVLVNLPSQRTHNDIELDVYEFNKFLCSTWCNISNPKNFTNGFHYHAQPAYNTDGNSYGGKEIARGNKDCWSEQASWLPKKYAEHR